MSRHIADPSEVLRLRWIDLSGNIVTINDPVKRHNPRQLRISTKLITMLNALPRTSERIFPATYDSMWSCFVRVKKRVARITQNYESTPYPLTRSVIGAQP